MGSISDSLLAAGCGEHIAKVHGESIAILSGVDAGTSFVGVVEIETDNILTTELGEDSRPKRIMRFLNDSVPIITSQTVVMTSDGRKWKCIRKPGASYLTTDFELVEFVVGTDT